MKRDGLAVGRGAGADVDGGEGPGSAGNRFVGACDQTEGPTVIGVQLGAGDDEERVSPAAADQAKPAREVR